ncbi:glutathione peroxidase [Marinicella sp. W31]|uniref:glutathione peroxidase n=1 Tax=Marinicella sp. W31 TaxID=3023713 RepID=UPI00375801F9
MSELFELKAKSLQGKDIDMASYKDKALLIVNTASKCGFTPQYAGLQKLYDDYKDSGLEILGFPCNQFGHQEPGTAEEIQDNCLVNYGVSFTMFEKIDVNGDEAHPIFQYLKEALPGTLGKRIKWNFTKFLIDADGNPVKRFAPTTKPEDMEKYVKKALKS